MTFRHVFFVAIEVFLGALLWHVSTLDTETSKELADTIPWVMFALMVIPLARFKADDLLTALRAWKGSPEKTGIS